MISKVQACSKDELQNLSIPESDLVIVFAPRESLEEESTFDQISKKTDADIVYVSTAGQICDNYHSEEQLSISSLKLEKSTIQTICLNISDHYSYSDLGAELYTKLDRPGLKGIIVFSDGTSVNGSALTRGLESKNRTKVPIAGGLAGDSSRFEKTYTGINEVREGNVVGIGLYGDSIHLGYGSRGGWQNIPQMNIISESEGNVLKKINGSPALEFYKSKLNGKLQELPSDALKYPMMVSDVYSNQRLVRTILSVDEVDQTMTFAGDMPLASGIQFLEATDDQLIHGAQSAATITKQRLKNHRPELAILISCIGRKLVLKDRISEEVKAVHDVLGADTNVTGFYSYGELSPSEVKGECELLNQTMTIVTISEDMC